MLQALNSSMIAVAMVSIGSHFGAGAEVSWVLSAFYIATAIVSPMAGVLGVVFGARRVYLAGLVLVLIGSVLGALAPTSASSWRDASSSVSAWRRRCRTP
ncbi:hypothetical protein CVAR21S_02628 [Corynebacterium variabile]